MSEVDNEIAKHFEALASLFRSKGELPFQSPGVREKNGHLCDCGLPAKSYSGIASSGPKKGKAFIKYFCPNDRCEYKKFEDA